MKNEGKGHKVKDYIGPRWTEYTSMLSFRKITIPALSLSIVFTQWQDKILNQQNDQQCNQYRHRQNKLIFKVTIKYQQGNKDCSQNVRSYLHALNQTQHFNLWLFKGTFCLGRFLLQIVRLVCIHLHLISRQKVCVSVLRLSPSGFSGPSRRINHTEVTSYFYFRGFKLQRNVI